MNVTRGFTGRPRVHNPGLPPGQYDAGDDWPVLSAEVTPDLAPADWTFRIDGLVAEPRTWDWDEAHALPASAYEGDIHCVTSWSKFGVRFGGVSLDAFLEAVRPDASATHAVAYSHTGYTTNLPLADLTGGRAWIAWEYDGSRCPPNTAARRGCWCRTCTSGRAPSGSRACGSSTTTSRASGNRTATTRAATPGRSSGTPVTEHHFALPDGPLVPPTRFAVPGRIAVNTRTATTLADRHAHRDPPRDPARVPPSGSPCPRWAGHLPGQHLMLRLTAEDGYAAQRHYSIASAPDDTGHIELTLDHVEGGEVSGWFHTVARPGDAVEVRGPLSGFFAWPGRPARAAVGAGSGVVPLMSMLRHHRARGLDVPLRLLVSARSPEELIYAREYGAETTPCSPAERPGRVCRSDVWRPHMWRPSWPSSRPVGGRPMCAAPTRFAEHASRLLVEAGQPVDRIRIERFG